jgi:hypothetical protein
MMVGCEVESNGTPSLTLDCYELNISGTGGDIPLFYSVGKPVKGAKPEVNTTVEWITVKETTSSRITLTIEPNNSLEPRQAILRIKYPGVDRAQTVYVNQSKAVLDKFSFEVTDVTYKSCTVHYTPTYPTRPYMANIIDSEYFKQTGITDGAQFVANEMESYLNLAQRNNLTLEELMDRVSPQLIYTGKATRDFTGMQPGATYTIYSYGVEFSGNSYTMTTPLHTSVVNIPMQEMYDLDFNVSTSAVGGTVSISVTPENWNGYYAVQIAPEDNLLYIEPGEPMSEYAIKTIAANFYTGARSVMANGYSAEQYLKSSCYTGPRTINMQLSSDKRYMVIVFAVESLNGEVPVMRSMPVVKHI